MQLTIIIPCFNEAQTLSVILERVIDAQPKAQIVVVDDGSTDQTQQICKSGIFSKEIQYVPHSKNRGKGAAIATGLQHASGDIVVIQDADLEYNPNEIESVIQPIKQLQADVVYGTRFYNNQRPKDCAFLTYAANRLLTGLTNIVLGSSLTDMETCYKAFRKSLIDHIRIQETGFGVEPEITAKLYTTSTRFLDVPISYSGRSYLEGKKIGIKDGIWAIWCIINYGVIRKRISRQ